MKRELLHALTVALLFLMPNLNFGQALAPDLKTSSRFALFTAAGAFNNTGLSTKVTGDVGNNTGAFNAFPPGTLMGLKFRGSEAAEAPITAQAALDVASAFAEITLENTCDAGHSTLTPTLGLPSPQVLMPNYYCIGSAATLNGELILDGGGNSNAVFVFRIGGAFATAVNSKITLRNGASACNVYWQINGAVSLAGSSSPLTPTPFQGTILANGAIELLVNAQLIGRGLSTAGAISTAENVVVVTGMPPTASTITAGGPTTFCAGGMVTLSGNVGGTWSTGATTPTITVTTSGDYFVTNTNGCQTVTSNHIIVTVNPQPVASVISGPTSVCAGGTVRLTGNVGGTWNFGGSMAPFIDVPAGGPYFVTNTSASCGSINSNMITVTAGASSTCVITSSPSCTATPTTFCVPAGAPSYAWTDAMGAAVAPIVGMPNCIPVTTGSYSVSFTTGGCVSTCTKTVTAETPPAANAGSNVSICAGASAVIGAAAVAGSTNTYLWTVSPASAVPVGANPTVMPAGAAVTTTYTYTLTETNSAGCSATNSVTVTVNPLPVFSISGTLSICQGLSTLLCVTPTPPGLTYLWNTGSTADCITVGAGAYSVIVKNANGCSNFDSKVVIANPPPVATTGSNVTICLGVSNVKIGAPQVVGSTYLWTPATGLSSATDPNPFASPTVTTTYTLTETITATGCKSSKQVTVTVRDLPNCNITGNGAICQGLTTTLCVSGASANVWSTGERSTCITVSTVGTYFVTVTDANGCTNICSKAVTLSSGPPPTPSVIQAVGSTTVCEGNSVMLAGNNNGGVWSNGETTQSIMVFTSGDYYVINTNGCSVNSNHIIVTVNPQPAPIIESAIICNGVSVMIGNYPITGHTYLWTPSTGLSSTTIANPIASAAGKIIYTLVETITATGCQRTSYVTVDPHPPCDCSCR